MAAVLWGTGIMMGAPKQARWIMIGLLMVAVMTVQIVLPDGHPLREATGGDGRLWALIIAFGGMIWAYGLVLGKVRARADEKAPAAAPPRSDSFSPTELEHYARHIVLREIGGVGQKALRDAKVLVVGAGGLGSPALQYLAAAGVGRVGVIDDDVVDGSNLQRQVIHQDRYIGDPKVHSARDAMLGQNPFVDVRSYNRRLTADIAEELIGEYDLVLDGTDNFETRYLVNKTCVALGKPLIAAALTQWEGQISVFDPARGAPCYACVFPRAPDRGLAPSCAEAGVLGPLPGVVGSMMAVEAVKQITNAGEVLRGRMLIYDALYADTRIIGVKKRSDCSVCGAKN